MRFVPNVVWWSWIALATSACGDAAEAPEELGTATQPASCIGASSTERLSVASDGTQGNGSSFNAVTSRDGRFVAYQSLASNLVPGTTGFAAHVFVNDRTEQTLRRVSVASDGTAANQSSGAPSLSSNGRYVAFSNSADNLVPGDTNLALDLFVHDLTTGETTRESLSDSGAQGSGDSFATNAALSRDGRFLVFNSTAPDLVPGDTNGAVDVFVRDRVEGRTYRVNVASDGTQANGDSFGASISGNGQLVAFHSRADNLVPGDTNGVDDVFVHDRATGLTRRVSVGLNGVQADGPSFSPVISDAGNAVAFNSDASSLDYDPNGSARDVFLHELSSGRTQLVSRPASGGSDGYSEVAGPIHEHGQYVAFSSSAANLVAGDSNGQSDLFVRDVRQRTTLRVNVAADGSQANGWTSVGTLSANGLSAVFDSSAKNLVPGDTNFGSDVFFRDLRPEPVLWQAGVRYELGARVLYAGNRYECLREHQSHGNATPADGSGYWQLLSDCGQRWIQVSVQGATSCALRSDGSVACWGNNRDGQASPPSGTFTRVRLGPQHACGLRSDGSLTCWGLATFGRTAAPAGTYADLATGNYNNCALDSEGSVTCWGDLRPNLTTVPSGPFTQIAVGYLFGCGLRPSGAVECWGLNHRGQARPPAGTFTAVFAGGETACALDAAGAATCWGRNDFGQAQPPAGSYAKLGFGSDYGCGLRTDGTLVCWSSEDRGRTSPPSGTYSDLGVGLTHSCAVSTTGQLACWGNGASAAP